MRQKARRLLLLCGCILLLTGGCERTDRRKNAEAVTSLGAGEKLHVIEGTDVTLRLESEYVTEELSPSAPSGYFYYYEDKEGYHYYVISGILDNPTQELLSPSCFGAAAWSGGKEYEAKVVLESSSGATFMGSDEETVGEAPWVYILVMVKDGEAAPDEVEFYYNDGLSAKTGEGLWNRGVRIDPSTF